MGLIHWLMVIPVVLVVAGVWFMYWPAALIVAGVCLAAWLLLRPMEVNDGVEGH